MNPWKRESPSPIQWRAPQGESIERTVRVITLMHGGGPVSSEEDHPQHPTRRHDEVTILRGSAVRGQLRFWWRATHGCTLESLEALREREDKLWGNASAPGKVDLRIEQGKLTTQDVRVESLGGVGQGLRYGAFAAANLTRVRGEARIHLVVGDASRVDEVKDALTAWLLFGGIGGRTRRGFGAVSSAGLPDPRDFVAGLQGTPRLKRVPALRGRDRIVLSRGSVVEAEEAHRAAVDALRRFRQGVDVGRNEGQQRGRPGRSRWPEADAIRRADKRYPGHHAPVHPVDAFPRGAFGMPIVFHFMGQGEPSDVQLVPSSSEGRMASPLILRPVPVGDRYHAMAVRLVVPDQERGFFAGKGKRPSVRVRVSAEEAAKIKPLAQHGSTPDVLAAFLHFFGA